VQVKYLFDSSNNLRYRHANQFKLTQIITMFTASLGFVTALAWNEAAQR